MCTVLKISLIYLKLFSYYNLGNFIVYTAIHSSVPSFGLNISFIINTYLLQVALLACCLIFNGTVTLLSLYIPKVYCIYFVDADQVQFQTAGTVGTTSVVPSTGTTQDK